MRGLLSVASLPVEIQTLPLLVAHRPSTQMDMHPRFGPGPGGGGGAGGGGGGGGYCNGSMMAGRTSN